MTSIEASERRFFRSDAFVAGLFKTIRQQDGAAAYDYDAATEWLLVEVRSGLRVRLHAEQRESEQTARASSTLKTLHGLRRQKLRKGSGRAARLNNASQVFSYDIGEASKV